MSINSVTGPIEPDALGVVSTHEHLFIDLGNQFREFDDPRKREQSRQKVCLENLGRLRLNPWAVKDNLAYDDLESTVEEVSRFKELGGRTIVDCTSLGLGRNVTRLREVALRTGVNVVAGSGYYTQDTHPPQFAHWPTQRIAERIVADLTDGINGSRIKAGVIGEVGTSDPIHPDERKSLEATALAFQQTGAPIQVHTFPWGQAGIEAIDLLLAGGVDPGKLVICHLDVEPKPDYIRKALKRGVFVQFDNFGKEFSVPPSERMFAAGRFVRDLDRVRLLRQIVEWGFERQILISNDICLKTMFTAFGGWGLAHILENIVPLMLDEGIAQETVDLFLRDNPRRWLS